MMDNSEIVLFVFLILASLALLIAYFYVIYIKQEKAPSNSPYTKTPLRRASDIPWSSKSKILRYLYDMHQYDNRIFEFRNAAYCRETGRIFINCVTWYGTIKVDWNFLKKRYPGNWVSWGSLDDGQQHSIRQAHGSLDGFQTDFSCPEPAPRAISAEYSWYKPGPLYVDLQTKILLGWKIVPDAFFEVLILQKPLPQLETSFRDDRE